MSRAGLRTTTLIAMAWAMTGILAGHALTYALLFPEAHAHDLVLAESGHAWLEWLWPLALVAAAVAVVSGLLSGTSRGASRGVRFVALAIVQVALFTALELAERATAGMTLQGLQHELFGHGLSGILIVGGFVQLVTAWFGSAVSRFVQHVAERIRRRASVRRATSRPPLRARLTRVVGRVDAAHAIRGPPSLDALSPLPTSVDGRAR